MFCNKCGSRVDPSDRFCDSCGAPISRNDVQTPVQTSKKPTPPPKKPMSKGKKALIICCTVLVLVVGLGITGIILIENSPAKEAIALFDDGELERAEKLYEREIADNEILNSIFIGMLADRLDSMIVDYSTGKVDYNEAIEYFTSILNMDILEDAESKLAQAIVERCSAIQAAYMDKSMEFQMAKSELSELSAFELSNLRGTFEANYSSLGCARTTLNAIELLNDSEVAFNRGEELYAQGNYEDALEVYSQVDENSEYYAQAQSMLTQLVSQYRTEVLDNARARVEDGDYIGAIALLEAALEIIADDAEITTKINTYRSEYFYIVKNDALTNSTNLRADGDFLQAIEVLEDALDIVGDDAELQRAYESSVNSYVEQVTSEVNAIIDEDWDAAYELIMEALHNLPFNEELINLNQEVLNAQPIKLNTLTVVDSSYYALADELHGIADSYGNIYHHNAPYLWADNMRNGKQLYVMYNLSQNYTSFSCIIAPHHDWTSDVRARVAIYLDDELVYEKSMMKTTAPFKVELDVTDSTLLKIYLFHEDGPGYRSDRAGIIIADGIVKN